jgi:hypothetical protein
MADQIRHTYIYMCTRFFFFIIVHARFCLLPGFREARRSRSLHPNWRYTVVNARSLALRVYIMMCLALNCLFCTVYLLFNEPVFPNVDIDTGAIF